MRKVDVEWTANTAGEGQERMVRLRVISQDMPGLLKSMSEAFASQGININNAQVRVTKDKKAICTFDASVKNTAQVTQVILELQKIRGVIGVSRVAHA
jgi:GTP pyrophosphokinase